MVCHKGCGQKSSLKEKDDVIYKQTLISKNMDPNRVFRAVNTHFSELRCVYKKHLASLGFVAQVLRETSKKSLRFRPFLRPCSGTRQPSHRNDDHLCQRVLYESRLCYCLAWVQSKNPCMVQTLLTNSLTKTKTPFWRLLTVASDNEMLVDGVS